MSRYLFDEATHQRHPLKPMVFVISSIYKDVDIVDRCIVEHYISGKHADRAVFGEDIQPGELGERVFYIPKAKHKGKDLWKHPDLEPLHKYHQGPCLPPLFWRFGAPAVGSNGAAVPHRAGLTVRVGHLVEISQPWMRNLDKP